MSESSEGEIPPQRSSPQEYRIGTRTVSRATYYRHTQDRRDDTADSSGSFLSNSSSPLSQPNVDLSSSSPSSYGPIMAVESPQISFETRVRNPFHSPSAISPQDTTHDFRPHHVGVDMWEIGG